MHQLSSNAPSSAQIDKIRRHLSSIYRWYLRNNYIEIILNEVSLQAPNYEILEAPFYKDPYGELKEWKVNVSVKLGQYSAEGWIALLENMKKGQNGIVLLRNKRVVIGGDDDKNFHPDLSGSSGSHRYKRLFGELELKGFKVSFNKNSFQEVEIVDQLLHEVAVQLRKDSENILIQADNYRTKTKEEMTKIADKAINELNKQGRQARSFDEKAKKLSPDNESNTSNNSKTVNPLSKAETIGEYRYDEMITINGQKYDLITEFVDGDRSQLYSVVIDEKKNKILDCKVIHCCINLAHNFFSSYPSLKSSTDYQPLIKIFRTLAVAEVTAKDSSSIKANTVRNLFNHYI